MSETNDRKGLRRFRRLPPAPEAHRFTKILFKQMNAKEIGVLDMADRSGINKNTITKWRTRYVPQMECLEACLNVVGLELRVEPIGSKLAKGGAKAMGRAWPPEAIAKAALLWSKGVILDNLLASIMEEFPDLDEIYEGWDSGFKSVRNRYPELFPPRDSWHDRRGAQFDDCDL